jgi:hypothetical protein
MTQSLWDWSAAFTPLQRPHQNTRPNKRALDFPMPAQCAYTVTSVSLSAVTDADLKL